MERQTETVDWRFIADLFAAIYRRSIYSDLSPIHIQRFIANPRVAIYRQSICCEKSLIPPVK
jgi:hypothetical protein